MPASRNNPKKVVWDKKSRIPTYRGIPVSTICTAIINGREDQIREDFPDILDDEGMDIVRAYIWRRAKRYSSIEGY